VDKVNKEERRKIIERVRKLLSRTPGAGATEAEAETAVAMARKLMDQYGLDLESINETTGEAEWVTDSAFEADGIRVPPEATLIGSLLTEFFHVQTFRSIDRKGDGYVVSIQIFGQPHHVEIARWVYVYLSGVFHDLWIAHRVKTKAAKRQQGAYYFGLGFAIATRLRREKAAEQPRATQGDGRDLVRVDNRLKEAFENVYPGMGSVKKPSYRDTTAILAGQKDGEGINISRPLAEKQARAIGGPSR